jgi:solute carrier family 25 carnitine/acylcarnitine transporter 20/29
LVLAGDILRDDGMSGFYSGVTATMAGQALIKGTVFLVYSVGKDLLVHTELGSSLPALVLAACISGAVGSLVVTPVERVKVLMQASEADRYASPYECVRELIRTNGVSGFLSHGLGATIMRETPAYGLDFVSYDLLKDALLNSGFLSPSIVPLVGGAGAGAMCWIPVYPLDVVKTNIQLGMYREDGFLETVRSLWKAGGFGVFWDGLGPKLARAVLNHAVTFCVYDFVCGST